MDTTDRTPRLRLPYLAEAQAQAHVTVNEGLRALDALVQPTVLSASVDAQPAGPAPGDAYLMTAGRTGAAWAGFAADDVASFQDGAWTPAAPAVGMTVWVRDEGGHRVWTGEAWAPVASGGGGPAVPPTRTARFGVNADADDANRLTVKSDAVLHSHDDASGQGTGDARHVINKAGAASTASLVFQSAYAGRAEMGLAGSDDFAVKVSSDGASFVEAIRIDRVTGAVSLPNTPQAGGDGAGGDGAGAGGQGGETIRRVLTAPLAKTNDPARAPIPAMSGLALPGGSRWQMTLLLYIEGPGAADATLYCGADQPDAGALFAEAGQRAEFPAATLDRSLRLSTREARFGSGTILGVLTAGAAETVFGFDWSQRIADPGTSTIHAGSSLVLTRLDD